MLGWRAKQDFMHNNYYQILIKELFKLQIFFYVNQHSSQSSLNTLAKQLILLNSH